MGVYYHSSLLYFTLVRVEIFVDLVFLNVLNKKTVSDSAGKKCAHSR